MKLYTEEQVKIAIDKARDYYDGFVYSEDEIIEFITPIELPSDEEIDEESPYVPDDWKIDYLSHQEGFIKGAKWVIEQIKQQDK